MKSLLLVVFFSLLLLADVISALRYSDGQLSDDYGDGLARFLYLNRKRSCIRRGGSCDDRPNDCCYSSSCRCNLWGTNCRCQRMGLFQRWGK